MRKLMVFFVALLAMVAGATAMASYPAPVRGFNYKGYLHYVAVNDQKEVAHWQATIDKSDWMGPWDQGLDSTLAFPDGYAGQDAGLNSTEGVVILGHILIHFAYMVDGSGNLALLSSRYDLDQPAQPHVFLDHRIVIRVQNTDNSQHGVAAAVLNGTLYVFASDFTLSSDDGVNYQQFKPILDTQSNPSLANYEPLDAVTFYPYEGVGKVMVAFADRSAPSTGYVVWDGTGTLPLPAAQFRTFGNSTDVVRGAALLLGTSGGAFNAISDCTVSAGNKVPCVQIILLGAVTPRSYIRRYEYDINADSLLGGLECASLYDTLAFRAFPWFEAITDNSTGFFVLDQYLVINAKQCDNDVCIIPKWNNMALQSDYMVPQNHDPGSNGYGWQGTPTDTSDQTVDAFRNYWTLLGVIWGPPPFAINTMSDVDISDASNVEYGLDETDSMEQSQTWSNSVLVSSKTEIKGGLYESKKTGGYLGLGADLDLSYKHAWEGRYSTKSSCTAAYHSECGTDDEQAPDWGQHGWAVVMAPILLTQVYKLYAYDYNGAGGGTYLQQDLTSISAAQGADPNNPQVNVTDFFFDLDRTHTGTNDQLQGLMDGIKAMPQSTDLQEWSNQTWEKPGAPWDVIYGSGAGGGSKVSQVSQGTSTTVTFCSDEEDLSSTGQTNSFDINLGVSFKAKTHLLGFKETLTAGYDSEWSSEFTQSTTLSRDLAFTYHMKMMSSDCTDSSCVKSLVVQPYLLKATDYDAKWIPTGFGTSLPWCMTWQVKGYSTVGGATGGECASPSSAGGTVVGTGSGKAFLLGAAKKQTSTYSIEGGKMAWQGQDGATTPIPITAKDFNPAAGAVVKLNDYAFNAVRGNGKWKRSGKVWKFKTKASIKNDAFTLKLDFGNQTWSFDGKGLLFTSNMKAADAHARITLTVNGLYSFYCDIEHQMNVDWSLAIPPSDPTVLEVTKYSGAFDTTAGTGQVLLEGTLPSALIGFGDVSFELNGFRYDVPLLSQPGFETAFTTGKAVVYQTEGALVTVDFGQKTWSASLTKTDFNRKMAPRVGSAKIGIRVGGETWYRQTKDIPGFTAMLSFKS